MKKILSIFLLSFLTVNITGCTNKTPAQPLQEDSVPNRVAVDTGIVADKPAGPDVKLHELSMTSGSNTIALELKAGDKVIVTIETKLPQTFFRISQVVYPDGTMDGPFGDGQLRDITQAGSYQFVISPNMMASNEVYTGTVQVQTQIIR